MATAQQLSSVGERPIAVLYGGRSSEREVSEVSGRAVLDALARVPHGRGGPKGLIGVEITAGGLWRIGPDELPPHLALERLPDDVLVFLGLHGGEGEDGRIQAFLETAGRAHTGSGPAASARCMDKRVSRALCAEIGVRVARGAWLSAARWRSDPGAAARGAWARIEAPEVVSKPNSGGSSVYTRCVSDPADLCEALEEVFGCGDDALVEERIVGTEATVGVLGNQGGERRALPVVEIRPRAARFFDYEEKYADEGAIEVCPPETLPDEAIASMIASALAAYDTLGCDGYGRADFIVPADGSEPVLLEVNTLPGFTPRSLLPRAAQVSGLSFEGLCIELCALALARRRG